MALIPPPKNTTEAAIDEAYKAAQPDGRREHLGFSIIGRECWREIWYSFRWATEIKHNGQLLRLFARGQDEEDRFAECFKMIGAEYWPVNPQTGEQFNWSFLGGHFGGSCDGFVRGIPEAPVALHVTEMKTHSDKSFKTLRAKGVQVAKPEHATQTNQYIYAAKQSGTDCTRGLYIAVNKNNDELYTERLKLDEEHAQMIEKKARDIITSDTPPAPIREDSSHYYCASFCDHANTCHRGKTAAASCRTCISLVADVEKGGWHCSHFDQAIDVATQRRGEQCPAHLFIPDLVPFAEAIDASESPRFVRYRIAGSDHEFVNMTVPSNADESVAMPSRAEWKGAGVKAYTSAELQHLAPELIQDQTLGELVTRFDGEIVANQ